MIGVGRGLLFPHSVRFDPLGASRQSFSFTFVRGYLRLPPTSYQIEWRSVSGDEVTLRSATVQILFASENGRFGCQ